MQRFGDDKEALRASSLVLRKIKADGVSPTPVTYAVLYAYFAQQDLNLCQEIDGLLSVHNALTLEHYSSLFMKYIAPAVVDDLSKGGLDHLGNFLNMITAVLEEVGSSTRTIGTRLKQAEQQAAEAGNGDQHVDIDVHDLVKELVHANSMLQGHLEKALGDISEIKSNLNSVVEEAHTDNLTGLCNRRRYDNCIERMLRDAGQSEEPLALLLADIDDFKKINDQYGHLVGDDVLRVVAKILGTGVRESDVVARYGGEEFAIIMPGTSKAGALEVAERLRSAVASRVIVNRKTGEKYGNVTISFGMTMYNYLDDPQRIFRRADKSLYAAKEKGKNCVVCLNLLS